VRSLSSRLNRSKKRLEVSSTSVNFAFPSPRRVCYQPGAWQPRSKGKGTRSPIWITYRRCQTGGLRVFGGCSLYRRPDSRHRWRNYRAHVADLGFPNRIHGSLRKRLYARKVNAPPYAATRRRIPQNDTGSVFNIRELALFTSHTGSSFTRCMAGARSSKVPKTIWPSVRESTAPTQK
jgi:hypothetical protein